MKRHSENRLVRAERRVLEAEQRIRTQREMLERFKARDDYKSLEITKRLLAVFQRDLQMARIDLDLAVCGKRVPGGGQEQH
jgi:hypothetical protein